MVLYESFLSEKEERGNTQVHKQIALHEKVDMQRVEFCIMRALDNEGTSSLISAYSVKTG